MKSANHIGMALALKRYPKLSAILSPGRELWQVVSMKWNHQYDWIVTHRPPIVARKRGSRIVIGTPTRYMNRALMGPKQLWKAGCSA